MCDKYIIYTVKMNNFRPTWLRTTKGLVNYIQLMFKIDADTKNMA